MTITYNDYYNRSVKVVKKVFKKVFNLKSENEWGPYTCIVQIFATIFVYIYGRKIYSRKKISKTKLK